MGVFKKQYVYGRYPYLGIDSYQDREGDRLVFYGRDLDKNLLLNKVLAEDFTLLFASSGLGKTSLINAALVNELRNRNYFPIVCRLTHSDEDGPIQSIYSCVEKEALEKGVLIKGEQNKQNLWNYFFTTEFFQNTHQLRPFIIIDQFEELFTRIRTHKEKGELWENTFIEQLADLVRHRVPTDIKQKYLARLENLAGENKERQGIVSVLFEGKGPEIKILIAIREDALPELEVLREHIPNMFSNAMRLEPFKSNQAREAITKPCQQTKVLGNEIFSFEPDAVNEIIQFLSQTKKGERYRHELTIEPTHLSILCRRLNEKRIEKKAAIITLKDLGGPRGMKRMLRQYYIKITQRLPLVRLGWNNRKLIPFKFNYILFNRPRAAVRKLCEKGLITSTGYRNSLIVQVVQRNYGLVESDLNKLVNFRLLRSEPRLGSTFYELSHDSLVGPIKQSRRRRIWMQLGSLSLLLLSLLVGIGYLYGPSVGYRSEAKRLASRGEEMQKKLQTEPSPGVRSALFRELAKQNWQNFNNLILSDISVENLFLNNADFAYSNLTDSKIFQSDMGYANLSYALLINADLSGSNLRGALFTGARLENINLANTNWWLAFGWPKDCLEQYKDKWSPTALLANTGFFQRNSEQLKNAINASSSNFEKASALNQLAWYIAIHGIDLDTALNKISEALDLLKHGLTYEDHWALLDTRGYILLQKHMFNDAQSDFAKSVSLKPMGEVIYHLGLAYEGMGQFIQAKYFFDVADKKYGYVPSYERLLTPKSIPVDFNNIRE